MKSFLFFLLTFFSAILFSQTKEVITVKAGTRIIDYFPPQKRYLYSEFLDGKAVFKSNTYTAARFNYNILVGEVQFIYKNDTLSVGNPESLKNVVIGTDTFYYDKGYLKVIAGTDPLMAVKQYIKFVDTGKESGYGTKSSTSAIHSYSNVIGGAGRSYKLTLNEDLILTRNTEYYLGNSREGFVIYRKKSIENRFPSLKSEIASFIKEKRTDFYNEEDLKELTLYINGLSVR
jgi:hypothetical protein